GGFRDSGADDAPAVLVLSGDLSGQTEDYHATAPVVEPAPPVVGAGAGLSGAGTGSSALGGAGQQGAVPAGLPAPEWTGQAPVYSAVPVWVPGPGGLRFGVVTGGLQLQGADVLVNAANGRLLGEGGVSGDL